MEWKIYLFLVCLLVTQVVSNCPDGCYCQSYYVRCVRTKLPAVPSDLSSDVQVLDLGINEIKALTRNSFSTTPNLETLLLNNNRITVLRNGVFENLSKLRQLHIYRNKINTIEPDAFKNLENLQELQLHYNNIGQLDDGVFKNLINLERLFLQYNTLINIQTGVFDTLHKIKNLRLDGNPLNCNCEVFWLVDSIRERNGYISGTCNTPKSHYNKSLSSLKSDEFNECARPRIIVEPNDVEIPENGSPSVTLQCEVRAYPKPRVSWEKDGKKIQLTNGKYEQVAGGLVIKSVSQADEGKYQCVASNNIDTVKSKVVQLKRATVKKSIGVSFADVSGINNVPPNGTVSPNKVTVAERKSVEINCTVSSNRDIQLVWLKNNTIVPMSSNSSKKVNDGRFVSILNLTDIRYEESGQYQCVSTDQPRIVFGSSEIIVEAAPKIIKHSDDFVIDYKSITAELRCIAVGYPTPVLTWYKDNNKIIPDARVTFQENNMVLKIEKALENDTGKYSCVAKNDIGSAEQETQLNIRNQDSRSPQIMQKPFDISIPPFSNVSIPCKTDGKPQPSIQWLKNDKPVIADDPRFRIQNNGSLNIFNVNVADSGVYKCIASNTLGKDSASGTLTVLLDLEYSKIITDIYIQQVVKNASLRVEKAINATLDRVLSKTKTDQSPSFLRSIFRYPDEYARNISKCREVFFIAVNLTQDHLRKTFNLPKDYEIRPEELFTPTQLGLIKRLSGCEDSLKIANCSADMAFHSKYATLDGTCNNLKHPQWGASYTAFRRLLKPIYANGIDTPIGWKKELLYDGYPRPSPRLVSASVIRTYKITPDEEITHMVMQWGQFMDHDLDHAPPSVTTESFNGVKCSDTCDYDEPCYPISIPANDSRHPTKPCFEFIRSTSILASGDDDDSNELPFREQLNQPSSYIDGGMVYGFNKERSLLLRDFSPNVGLLKKSEGNYLPTAKSNISVEVDCKLSTLVNNTRPNQGCYFAGDVRVNEMVGLLTIHTIWFREHNRLATELKKINPDWDGDQIFYEARKILAAELQHITYQHWLKHIIGPEGIEKLGPYNGYDPTIKATISNVFATAALRVGHTIINPQLVRLDHNFNVTSEGNLPLSKSFFAPWRLTQDGGVDPIMRGFFAVPAKRKYPTENLNEQIIDHLFENRTGGAMDLAALNIQRSRDHGLPGYAAYRKVCNLSEPRNFDDLKSVISSDQVRDKLKELYGHPGNVDVWVGGILEDQRKGAIVGPLFQCLLSEQFKRLRDGDRFWYENPTTFTPSQLAAIKQVTLSRILCDNGDNITTISRDVFILPSLQNSTFVSCNEIPKLDLKPWSSPKV